jgi:hypothetical protein
LIQDKVDKSTSTPRKTKLEALAKFEDVLNQELAAKAKKNGAIDKTWQKMMGEAVHALQVEALDKSLLNDGQDALDTELDTLVLNKGQKVLKEILTNSDKNASPKLLERCVKKMLASDEGKKDLESSTHLSMNALKAVRDPKMGVDFLTSCDLTALDGADFSNYVNSLGDQKDDVLAKVMFANAKKPLPTNPTDKAFAVQKRAKVFSNMAQEMDPANFAELAKTILKSDEGKQALVDNPKLGGALFNSIDPAALKDFDFDATFGPAKDDILAESMVMLSMKNASSGNGSGKPPVTLDPKLFKLLATKIDPKVWNDKAATTGARKGLGARVGMELWNVGGYEQICDLIKHGVDTSLPTLLNFSLPEWKKGTHSGFVSPMQHIIAPYLRDVGRLEAKDPTLKDEEKEKAEGAQKIFAALAAKQKEDEKKAAKLKEDEKKNFKSTVTTLTSWSDLQESEWMKAFNEKPGTIWGFENVRAPYVQAGHASTKKSRPLRMWELWDALGVDPTGYDELLKDPEGYADKKVAESAQKIKDKESTRVEYGDIKDLDEFLEEFKKDAKAVLLEFAAQMPKGTFADSAKEAGFMEGKFLGGLGCKAGLWWAKEQKEPIYYCLDGINMDDVTNYKKVKSAAIDDYLSAPKGKSRYNEVITMVEVREILKNWEDLKFKNDKDQDEDVVKFVYKGKILSGQELDDNIKKWKADMEQVNKSLRTAAPDYKTTFTTQLNKIDPGLLAKLAKETDAKKANVEAREIVKKHGYFVKLANTKPHIALKYIMYKCDTLGKYGLISKGLPPAAVALKKAIDAKDDKKIATAESDVRNEIKKCHHDYQAPLESALFRHQTTGNKL